MAALTERNWYRPYARLGVEIGPTASCSGLQSKVIQLALSAEAIQWYGNVARYLSTFEDGKESINSPSYRASPENSTPVAWTDVLDAAGVRISMDGKGRWIDNVFIERLWRSVKYEDIYLRAYENGRTLQAGLTRYFDFCNQPRIHQSHDYQTPDEIYCATSVGEPLAIAA